MVVASAIPIQDCIVALMQERNRLFAYPPEQLASEIRATGFLCNRCGRVAHGKSTGTFLFWITRWLV